LPRRKCRDWPMLSGKRNRLIGHFKFPFVVGPLLRELSARLLDGRKAGTAVNPASAVRWERDATVPGRLRDRGV
jgi:hypothetical protein